MANYIKIKAADIGVANVGDLLLGGIVSVQQGLVNGTGSADKIHSLQQHWKKATCLL